MDPAYTFFQGDEQHYWGIKFVVIQTIAVGPGAMEPMLSGDSTAVNPTVTADEYWQIAVVR